MRRSNQVTGDLVIDLPQLGAKAQQQTTRQARILAHPIQELASSQRLDLTIRGGARCSAMRAILDHPHLAEPIALANMADHDVIAAYTSHNLDLASTDPQHAVALIHPAGTAHLPV